MTVYMTETEQLEAIKKWWKKYSNLITIFLSVVLLAISGYKYWHWHQDKITFQASNAYEQMMLAFSNQDNKAVRGYASQLLHDYGQTVYADAARLTLAKLYAAREKYPEAELQLAYVATHSKVLALQEVASIRLARMFAQDKSYEKALTELSRVNSSVYRPVVNELRGDIFAATGKYEQAVTSYREAIQEVQKKGMGNLFLEMKTNEMAAVTQSMMMNERKLEKV
ncbi:MAG: tetratricopeptide repeat protein [Legionellales bacterium]|nr:tetratricopeptide repeat protein [Legionellales bacterium]